MHTFSSVFVLVAAASFVNSIPNQHVARDVEGGLHPVGGSKRQARDTPVFIDHGLSTISGSDDAGDDDAKKVRRDSTVFIDHGISPTFGDEDKKVKREDTESNEYGLEKRKKSNYISSCGKNWMPVGDDRNKQWQGYNSSVDAFCYHTTHTLDNDDTIVGPKQKYGVTVQNGFALTGGTPASIDFEIHNNMKDGTHTVNEDDCKTYLENIAVVNGKCYGKKNKDTKGGTWQVGEKIVSYHALPNVKTG